MLIATTYSLEIIALLLLWTKAPKYLSYILFSVSIVTAFTGEIITPIGIIISFICIALIYISYKLKIKPIVGIVFFCLTAIFLLLGYMHIIPGFNNICILKNTYISKDAIPFTLYLNYSSILFTYLLLIICPEVKLCKLEELSKTIGLGLIYGIIAILILLPISYTFQFIKFDFKLTKYTLIFIFVNLVFTCISEEVFWRGFIQNKLKNYSNETISLLITSFIFATIHIIFAGIHFAILAFIASIIYGITYIKTKRIEASIVCHYVVNLGQFIFFTYPILASVNTS